MTEININSKLIDLPEVTAPATPATGTAKIYNDSADGEVKVIYDTGAVEQVGSDEGFIEYISYHELEYDSGEVVVQLPQDSRFKKLYVDLVLRYGLYNPGTIHIRPNGFESSAGASLFTGIVAHTYATTVSTANSSTGNGFFDSGWHNGTSESPYYTRMNYTFYHWNKDDRNTRWSADFMFKLSEASGELWGDGHGAFLIPERMKTLVIKPAVGVISKGSYIRVKAQA